MKVELDLTEAEARGLLVYIVTGQAEVKYSEQREMDRSTQKAADWAVRKYSKATFGFTESVNARKAPKKAK